MRELNVALTRLCLNSAPLNGYLYRIGVCDSAQCICGHGEESVHHFFLSCPLYAIEREQLMRALSEVVSVSLPVILCGSSACNNNENERIVKAVHIQYIYTKLETFYIISVGLCFKDLHTPCTFKIGELNHFNRIYLLLSV